MGGVNEFCQQLITVQETSDINYNDFLNQEITSQVNTNNENTLNTNNENTLIVSDIDERTIDILLDEILTMGSSSSNSFALLDSIRLVPMSFLRNWFSILLSHPSITSRNNN